MPSDAITDKFGCVINPGDWVLYVPVADKGVSLKYGQVESFGKILGSMTFVNIKDTDEYAMPYRCVLFSQEEYTMRKLESDNG